MSEIPEDIMDAAESVRINYVIPDPAEVRIAIAEAILAERERHGWQSTENAPTKKFAEWLNAGPALAKAAGCHVAIRVTALDNTEEQK